MGTGRKCLRVQIENDLTECKTPPPGLHPGIVEGELCAGQTEVDVKIMHCCRQQSVNLRFFAATEWRRRRRSVVKDWHILLRDEAHVNHDIICMGTP